MSILAVILTPIIVYTIFLAVHWIPFRLTQVNARTKALTLTLLCCFPLMIPAYQFFKVQWALSPELTLIFAKILVLICFTLLWCGYVQFVFAFDTSPSLRFLIEILNSPRKALSSADLHKRFNFSDVYHRRFQRAVKGGALIEEISGDKRQYRNGKTAKRLAIFGRTAKDFMNLGDGG